MTQRVLVADDDELTLEILATILDLEHFEVVTAIDGGSALGLILAGGIDVAVLDVMMPELDGLEVCRRLKAEPATSHIPVILLTARGSDEQRRLAQEAGAAAFLTKPFSPLALIKAIASLGGAPVRGTR